MQNTINIFILSNATCTTELWPKETDGAYCNNKFEAIEVSNQVECQDICKTKASCVGISYRNKPWGTGTYRNINCRTCKDDTLTYMDRGFDFYRRQG